MDVGPTVLPTDAAESFPPSNLEWNVELTYMHLLLARISTSYQSTTESGMHACRITQLFIPVWRIITVNHVFLLQQT